MRQKVLSSENDMVKMIEGGVTAAKGFKAGGINAGIRKGKTKNDLALIVSECECAAAGLFTRNKVKAAPVQLDIETVKSGKAMAIIANSGNANACAPMTCSMRRKCRSAQQMP